MEFIDRHSTIRRFLQRFVERRRVKKAIANGSPLKFRGGDLDNAVKEMVLEDISKSSLRPAYIKTPNLNELNRLD